MNKTINNLTFLSKGDNWFWDNDENGMTYFIYDPNHNIHDTIEKKQYQIIMTPQSEIGNILKLNIIPNVSACVVESDDNSYMESWMNNMSNGLFPAAPVPEYIIQYESTKQYVNSLISNHMTESDTAYLYKKALKSYNLTESDIDNFIIWEVLDESENEPENLDNVEKFIESAGNIAANIGAGGIGALIMRLTKSLPGKWQAVWGIASAIGAGIAKYFGTAASVKKSEEYKNLVAEGKADEAAKLVNSKSIKSAAQAVAAAGAGALAAKFLPNLISKTIGKSAVNMSAEQAEQASKEATTAAKEVLTNNSVADNAKVELPTIDKMSKEQLSKVGAAEYKDFLAKNPDGLDTLLKNPEIVNNPNELAELYQSGAFNNMNYNQLGQIRNNIKANGGDPTQFQGMLNAMVSPDLKGAKQFADLGVKQDVNMIKAAGNDKFLTNQYITADQSKVLRNASLDGLDTNAIKGQVGQNNFYNSMGLGQNNASIAVNGVEGVNATYNPTTNSINFTNTKNGVTGTYTTTGVSSTAKGNTYKRDANGNVAYYDNKGNQLNPAAGATIWNQNTK